MPGKQLLIRRNDRELLALDEALTRLQVADPAVAELVSLRCFSGLTIREAADDLGLTYEGYLDLLAQKDLPATAAVTRPEALESLRRSARRIGQC